MKLIIVSGLSGSGKSTVLHVLEDMRFYAIDNLPVSLLETFARHMIQAPEKQYEFTAVGIDARNRNEELQHIPRILGELRRAGIECEVIFLDADDAILIKRFSETRRKHPLTDAKTALPEAIERERQLLDVIAQEADLYVDSSHTSLHELRGQIKQRVVNKPQEQSMSIMFESFGFKHGVPTDADMVFDVRCLPNPYWEPHLRGLTGKDQPVISYLEQASLVNDMLEDISEFLQRWIPRFENISRTYLTIAVGCTGGHHRSVYIIEKLAERFSSHGNVITRHREL